MRSLSDRIRHTVFFELIGLVILTISTSIILNQPMLDMGILNIIFSVLAMAWNLIFNWLFDLWDRKFRNMAPRTILIRIVHACLFEGCLLIAGMFITAWWLGVTLLMALLIDIGFSIFFVFYTFSFNWAYDEIFPVPVKSATG